MPRTSVREVLEAIGAKALGKPTGMPPSSPVEPAAPAAAGAAKKRPSIVQLQKSRLAYDGLRKSVQDQLRELEQGVLAAVRAHNRDEAQIGRAHV